MNIISIRSIFTTLAFYALASSCNSQAKDPDRQRLQDANDRSEQAVGQFDPAFQTSPKNTHLAVRVSFDNDVIQPATVYSTRAGSLPFSREGGSDFAVEVMDASGKAIAKYYMQNPMTVRVCDGEPNPPGVRPLTRGTFDLLLPNDKSITNVTFTSNGKSIGTVAVPLGRMQEGRETDGDPTRTRNDTLRGAGGVR